MTALYEDPTPDVEDDEWCPGGPSWCIGGHDDDDAALVHETEFEWIYQATESDVEVGARLVQDGGDAMPMVELAANDDDSGSALVRLSLDQARELAATLRDLIYRGECG